MPKYEELNIDEIVNQWALMFVEGTNDSDEVTNSNQNLDLASLKFDTDYSRVKFKEREPTFDADTNLSAAGQLSELIYKDDVINDSGNLSLKKQPCAQCIYKCVLFIQ